MICSGYRQLRVMFIAKASVSARHARFVFSALAGRILCPGDHRNRQQSPSQLFSTPAAGQANAATLTDTPKRPEGVDF